MNTHKMLPTSCPKCGEELEATTNVKGDAGPSEGDWTICLYCGEVLRFNAILGVRSATASEWITLEPAMQWELAKMVMFTKLRPKRA